MQPGRHDAANRLALYVIFGGLALMALVIQIAEFIGNRKNEPPGRVSSVPSQSNSPFEGVWFDEAYTYRVFIVQPYGTGERRVYQNSLRVQTWRIAWTADTSQMAISWQLPDAVVSTRYKLLDSNHMVDEYGERWTRLLGGVEALNQVEYKLGQGLIGK